MEILIQLITIAICVGFQAFFAAVEIAFLTCDRVKVRHLASRGNYRAQWADHFILHPVKYLTTTMIGVNLSVVVASSISSHLASSLTNESVGPLIGTIFLWPLILLFGEFIPMSLALAHPFRISMVGVYGIKAVYFLFYPAIRVVAGLTRFLNRAWGKEGESEVRYLTRDELKLLLRAGGKDPMDFMQDSMLKSVFDFHKVTIQDIMVPIKQAVSCSAQSTVGELKKVIFESAYSRIPIYRDEISRIVGYVHSLDLVGIEDERKAEAVMKMVIYISGSRPAAEVLRMMWGHQINLAVVIGARRQSIGIVTMEDILEEVVGEIEDEYDSGGVVVKS